MLAALLPDRWGLAAAASSIDLRGINADHPSQVGADALWQHTSGQWILDLTVLGVLSAVFYALAVWRLQRRLRPPRSARPATRRTRHRGGSRPAEDIIGATPPLGP